MEVRVNDRARESGRSGVLDVQSVLDVSGRGKLLGVHGHVYGRAGAQ